jgi:N-methylhydantoinase A
MTRAIRRVTLERGHDPRRFALVAFGGAGPMHAAALADRLGVETVRVPRASGVLSALGLLAADERHDASRTDRTTLAAVEGESLRQRYEALTARVLDEATDRERATVTLRADLRYEGQSHELSVAVERVDSSTLAERFHATHERVRGYRLDDEPVELVTLRATATVPGDSPEIAHEGSKETPARHRQVSFEGEFRETPVYDHGRLPAGTTIDGPAVVEGGESTVVVPPGWQANVDSSGTLALEVTG